MDPFSILGVAGTVSKLAIGCTSTLYSFTTGAKVVDVTVQGLYDEVKALKLTAGSVESTLQLPDLQAFQDAQLWADADACLRACETSLHMLNNSLTGLQSAKSKNPFSKAIAQVKLDMKEEQITKYRASIHSHRLALEGILQLINIRISSTAPEIILSEIMPQLHSLQITMANMQEDVRMMRQRNTPSDNIVDEHESFIIRTNEQLTNSAQAIMVEIASTVVGDNRSTIFGGTEPDLDFASSIGGVPLNRTSPLNDRLSSVDRVRGWVYLPHRTANEPDVPESDGSTSEKTARNPPLRTTSNYTEELPEEGYSSDEEDDVKVVRGYLKFSRAAAQQSNFTKAESLMRKALQKPRLLARLATPTTENDLKHELAILLVKLDRTSDARNLCDELVKQQIRDDTDRVLVHDAFYTLAQIDYIEGNLPQAKSRCRQVVRGRSKLTGKNEAYFNAVALLVEIMQANDEPDDAEVWEDFLPADFLRPAFKKSRTLSSRAQGSASRTSGSSSAATQPATIASLSQVVPATKILSRDEVRQELSDNRYLGFRTFNFDAFTPFAWATAQGDVVVVKELLRTIPDINQPLTCYNYNLTPLHMAAFLGHLVIIDVLIAQRANVNSLAERNDTPLHLAALNGYTEVAKLLLERGAGVNAKNNTGWTALHEAAQAGHTKTAQVLLERGVDVNAKDNSGRTALHQAAQAGHTEGAKVLLKHGADVNMRDIVGWTALHTACLYGNSEEFVKLLLARGADRSIKTGQGDTAHRVAKGERHKDIMTLLENYQGP